MTQTSPRRSPRRRMQDELRIRGLPLVLEPAVRRRALLIRATPVLLGMAMLTLGLDLITDVSDHPVWDEDESQPIGDDEVVIIVAALVGLSLIVLAPLGAWLTSLVLRGLTRARIVVAAIVVLALLVSSFLTSGPTLPQLAVRMIILVLIMLATYLGVGTMLGWAGRRALRELSSLGPMISRVLPVLLIAVLFLFFNSNLWQIAANLDPPRVWGSVAVIGVLALLLTIMNSRDGATQVLRFVPTSGPDDSPAIRVAERINIVLVVVLVTVIQTVWFGLLTLIFFVLFGHLTIADTTAELWIERDLTPASGLLSITPFSQELFQVSLLLAGFSALNFAASASIDQQYRSTFIQPVLTEIERGLQLRRRYLAGSASVTPQ